MPTAKGKICTPDMYQFFKKDLEKEEKKLIIIRDNCLRMIEKSKQNEKIIVAYYRKELSDANNAMENINNILKKIKKTFFSRIIGEHNQMVFIAMLNGHVWRPGHRLGEIGVSEIKRSFNKKTKSGEIKLHIDWKATNEMWKETGVRKGHIYFTNDSYCCVKWRRNTSQLKNKSGYKFSLTTGENGNKKRASKFFRENPHLSVYYLYEEGNKENPRLKNKVQRLKPNINDLQFSIG
jgi:hypothetical protein